MKKEVEFVILFVFLISLSAFIISAQTNATTEEEKIDKAYSCLLDKVKDNCATISTEEKIFSLLTLNRCRTEVIADSYGDGTCWPGPGEENCQLKTTAQAILALNAAGANTDKAKEWLLFQSRSPPQIIWYLQIESSEATTCAIYYNQQSFTVNIGEDKKLAGDAGPCLTRAYNNYWFEILHASSYCKDLDFDISCDKNFLTNLLFKKLDSSTIYVSEESSSASAGGGTTEKIKSSCFAEKNICNYEGSLWAAMVLSSLGEDVSSYLPYLITMAEDNARYFPEIFLYAITLWPDYRISVLSKQKSSKWWTESGDRYYDTALALYPFRSDVITEKTNTKEWLLEVQDTNGCWENNLRNTAFILHSIWPRSFAGDSGGTDIYYCEDAGFYCVTTGACEGAIRSEYVCGGINSECCNVAPAQKACADLGGIICDKDEYCKQGTSVSASGLLSGQICCVGSSSICEANIVKTDTCSPAEGICRVYGCAENEEITTAYVCEYTSDYCCLPKTTPKKASTLWLWILGILIILVIIGIIFKDKLREFLFKLKPKKSRGGLSGPIPGFRRPPPPHFPILRRPHPMTRPTIERKILPSRPPAHPPRPMARPQKTGAQRELDDVLKKLKEMGK